MAHARPTGAPAITALVVGLVACGLALLAGPLRDQLGRTGPGWVLPVLVLGYVLAERLTVDFRVRGSSQVFTFSDVPLVVGLVFCSPVQVVLAQVIAYLLVAAVGRELHPLKSAFNVAQSVALTPLAATFVLAVAGTRDPRAPQVWAAVGVAVLVTGVLSTLLICLAMAVTGDRADARQVRAMVTAAVLVAVGNANLGLLAVALVASQPVALALLVIPVLLAVLANRAHVEQRRGLERLQFLHDATRHLASTSDVTAALRTMLRRCLEHFGAQQATVFIAPKAEGSEAGRLVVVEGEPDGELAPLDPGLYDRCAALIPAGGTLTALEVPTGDALLDEHLSAAGVRHGMLVTLPGQDHQVGLMLLANRAGFDEPFDDDELRLFATLGSHASMSLRFEQLGQMYESLEEQERRYRHESTHDPLTGIGNRALFDERLRGDLRSHDRLAVVYVDLDGFKPVNDRFGHAAGDAVLVAVAERLAATARPVDAVARIGGDEFAMIVTGVDAEQARAVGERVLAEVRAPVVFDGELLSVGASIGIAVTERSGMPASAVLERADEAMYEAKHAGKGQVRVVVAREDAITVLRRGGRAELVGAIERGEMETWFQPIVSLESGLVTGAEALVRWRHPVRGLLLPGDFLSAAETGGLMAALGEQVLDEACANAARWGGPPVHVNLSARQLQDGEIVRRIESALRHHGLDPSRLVLEISEPTAGAEPKVVVARLEQLAALGVRIALDDFGSAGAALDQLARLPVHTLKLSRSLVDLLGRSERSDTLAAGVAAMAALLDIDVVAEGIELEAQRERLRRMALRRGQGFLFSPAVPAEVLTARLDAERRTRAGA